MARWALPKLPIRVTELRRAGGGGLWLRGGVHGHLSSWTRWGAALDQGGDIVAPWGISVATPEVRAERGARAEAP